MIIDSSPLIIFGKLNRFDILKKLFKNVEITKEVYNEVVIKGIEKNLQDALIIKEHIEKKDIKVVSLNEVSTQKASKIERIYGIDYGESQSIALALQSNEHEIIIDEISAREAAKYVGLRPIGSLRVLLLAYKKNLLSKDELKKLIFKMEDSKYRFSPKVLIEFWDLIEKIK